ncbi:type IV secretion system protein, partial [Salmonella enterica]|uniref:type IV secretion system protein n=1 Tax=Salmonella enterica TaxID=28901 RepID=UPI003D2D7683
LFAPTKSYFDGWLRLMISYSLQPMVVAAYMAMMLTVFDQAVFGNCQFVEKSLNFEIGGMQKRLPFFILCDPQNPVAGCVPVATDNNATDCQ